MYQPSFGTKQQIKFKSEAEFFEFLGFLAKGDGTTKIVWEDNDQQGAWGKEGRIEFFVDHPANLRVDLEHTAGNGNILSRVNCNEFVENIATNYGFVLGQNQDKTIIVGFIPNNYLGDFNAGLAL